MECSFLFSTEKKNYFKLHFMVLCTIRHHLFSTERVVTVEECIITNDEQRRV